MGLLTEKNKKKTKVFKKGMLGRQKHTWLIKPAGGAK